MPVEIAAEKIVVMLAKQIVPAIQTASQQCNEFNDLPNIPWHMRQQVRTIEGFLDKAETEVIDLVSRFNSDEALDYVEATWPSD